MRFCGKCGAKNPDEATFCGSCGAPLDKLEEPSKPVEKKPKGSKNFVHKPAGRIKPLQLAYLAIVLVLAFKIIFPSPPTRDGKPVFNDTYEDNDDLITQSGIFDTHGLRFGMSRGEAEAVLSGMEVDTEVVSDFCGDQVRMLGYKDVEYNGRNNTDLSVGFASTGALCMVSYAADRNLYDDTYKQLKSMYGEPSSTGGTTAWQLSKYICVGVVRELDREGVVIWDSGQMPVSWSDLIGSMKEVLSTESGRYMMRACIDGLFLVADSFPEKHAGKIETPYGDYKIEIEGDPDYDAMREDMQAMISNFKKGAAAAEAGR